MNATGTRGLPSQGWVYLDRSGLPTFQQRQFVPCWGAVMRRDCYAVKLRRQDVRFSTGTHYCWAIHAYRDDGLLVAQRYLPASAAEWAAFGDAMELLAGCKWMRH